MKIRTKLFGSHIKGCLGVKRDYPWCLLGQEFNGRGGAYEGDKRGGKRGWHSWIKAICLDPRCNAEIAFSEEDIFTLILK